MTRNTDQRVEVAAPIFDVTAKRRLHRILKLCFEDNTNARELLSDGKYHSIQPPVGGPAITMQTQLYLDSYKDSETKSAAKQQS